MGRPSELSTVRERRGIALATVLMVMVILVAIPAALFAVISTQSQAEVDRADQRQAEYIAEAGAAHASVLINSVLGGVATTRLLLGSDGVAGGGDDGILVGHAGLTATTQIPAAGVDLPGAGRYYVRVIDDEFNVAADVRSGARIGGSIWADGGTHDPNYLTAPTDGNNWVVIQCLGVTRNGARASVNLRLRRDPSPGITLGGDVSVAARVNVTGACADIRANTGSFLDGSAGNFGLSGNWPIADNWYYAGTIPTRFEARVSKQQQAALPWPTVPAFETLCGAANVVRYYAMGNTDRTQAINLDNIADGSTHCVYGHVTLTCNTKCRNSATSPRVLSVIATGSIRLTVNRDALLAPAHPDGWQFFALGDIDLTETGTNVLTLSAQSTTYCGSDLRVDVNLNASGQIICTGAGNPPRGPSGPTGPQTNFLSTGLFVTGSTIGKLTTINFDCGGTLANKLVASAWYPTIGS